MNVLVVTNMYPNEQHPFYGIFVREQVESLRAAGIMVDVYFINGRSNRLNYIKSLFDLSKKFKGRRYDIIHAHHSYCVFPIKMAQKITFVKTPVVLSFHEGEVHLANEVSLQGVGLIKRLAFSKKLKLAALKMVDFVLAVQAEMLTKLNFMGKSMVLPCGVDADLFKPFDQKWCRKKLDLPYEKKIIFYPASPSNKQKGIDILKEAMSRLSRNDLLLITGGDIAHEKMPYYMNAADVVVQLSIFEASPSVLKEALAVNTTSVFTDAGDAGKIINTNCKGYFLSKRNPADVAAHIEKALRYNGKCNGREQIVNTGLTLNAISEKIIAIYQELLKRKGLNP